jgi:hypothetical protein
MKILIRKVTPGTIYDGKVSDFWIKGQLIDGQTIEIFDATPYDLREMEDQTLDCLLISCFTEIVNKSNQNENKEVILEGTYLGPHDISNKWKNVFEGGNRIYKLASKFYGINSENGILLATLDKNQIESLNEGDNLRMRVGRYDLVAWLPIEG